MNSQGVDSAITSRMSVRAFTDRAVPRELLEQILTVASRAPSCCMALGYADEDALVKSFHTPREPVRAFTHWLE